MAGIDNVIQNYTIYGAGSSGGSTPAEQKECVKVIDTSGALPTKRKDGSSALINGDYCLISFSTPLDSFPLDLTFTESGATITIQATERGQKIWFENNEWFIDAGVVLKTNEVPVNSVTNESISGTANYQNLINQENKTRLNKIIDNTNTDNTFSISNNKLKLLQKDYSGAEVINNEVDIDNTATQNSKNIIDSNAVWKENIKSEDSKFEYNQHKLVNKLVNNNGTTILEKSVDIDSAVTENSTNLIESGAVYNTGLNNSNSSFELDKTDATKDKINIKLKDNTGNEVINKTIDFEDNIVLKTATQTITNKSIDCDNNTISNVEIDNFKSGVVKDTYDKSAPSATKLLNEVGTKDAIVKIDTMGAGKNSDYSYSQNAILFDKQNNYINCYNSLVDNNNSDLSDTTKWEKTQIPRINSRNKLFFNISSIVDNVITLSSANYGGLNFTNEPAVGTEICVFLNYGLPATTTGYKIKFGDAGAWGQECLLSLNNNNLLTPNNVFQQYQYINLFYFKGSDYRWNISGVPAGFKSLSFPQTLSNTAYFVNSDYTTWNNIFRYNTFATGYSCYLNLNQDKNAGLYYLPYGTWLYHLINLNGDPTTGYINGIGYIWGGVINGDGTTTLASLFGGPPTATTGSRLVFIKL